jgi:hypothetical protein
MGRLAADSAAADVSAWLLKRHSKDPNAIARAPPGSAPGSVPGKSSSSSSGNDAVLVFLPGIKEITTVRACVCVLASFFGFYETQKDSLHVS